MFVNKKDDFYNFEHFVLFQFSQVVIRVFVCFCVSLVFCLFCGVFFFVVLVFYVLMKDWKCRISPGSVDTLHVISTPCLTN